VLAKNVVIDQALDFVNGQPFSFAALLQTKKEADSFMPKRVKMQLILMGETETVQSDFTVDISVCLNTGKPMYRLPISNMEGENYIDVQVAWN